MLSQVIIEAGVTPKRQCLLLQVLWFLVLPSQTGQQHVPSTSNKVYHLVKIKCCKDTRPQNQLNAAKEQHKISATFSKEPPLLSTSSLWVCVAPSTTHSHSEAF